MPDHAYGQAHIVGWRRLASCHSTVRSTRKSASGIPKSDGTRRYRSCCWKLFCCCTPLRTRRIWWNRNTVSLTFARSIFIATNQFQNGRLWRRLRKSYAHYIACLGRHESRSRIRFCDFNSGDWWWVIEAWLNRWWLRERCKIIGQEWQCRFDQCCCRGTLWWFGFGRMGQADGTPICSPPHYRPKNSKWSFTPNSARRWDRRSCDGKSRSFRWICWPCWYDTRTHCRSTSHS